MWIFKKVGKERRKKKVEFAVKSVIFFEEEADVLSTNGTWLNRCKEIKCHLRDDGEVPCYSKTYQLQLVHDSHLKQYNKFESEIKKCLWWITVEFKAC